MKKFFKKALPVAAAVLGVGVGMVLAVVTPLGAWLDGKLNPAGEGKSETDQQEVAK